MSAAPPEPPDRPPLLRFGSRRWSIKLYTVPSVLLFFATVVVIAWIVIYQMFQMEVSIGLGTEGVARRAQSPL